MTVADKKAFTAGFRDALPIFIGYFAVSFALGITAHNAGLTAFEASLMSFLNTTSAGQAAAIEIIKDGGTYVEIVLSQLAINMRYLLMGAALTIHLRPEEPMNRRLLVSLGLTDEIFGICTVRAQKPLNPMYALGAFCMAMPGWVLGTFLGATVNGLIPQSISNALSIGLYSMFLAIIIPPSLKNAAIAVVVVISMGLGFVFYKWLPEVSSGMRVILLTVGISAAAAVIRPVGDVNGEGPGDGNSGSSAAEVNK